MCIFYKYILPIYSYLFYYCVRSSFFSLLNYTYNSPLRWRNLITNIIMYFRIIYFTYIWLVCSKHSQRSRVHHGSNPLPAGPSNCGPAMNCQFRTSNIAVLLTLITLGACARGTIQYQRCSNFVRENHWKQYCHSSLLWIRLFPTSIWYCSVG